jgi:hypothetical protein
MEYHNDRFVDHSFMVFEQDVLIACIPAHIDALGWYSHRGLTYGGIVINRTKTMDVLHKVIAAIETHFKTENPEFIIEFNLAPPIYNPFHEAFCAHLETANYQITREQTNMHAALDGHLSISPKKTAGYRNGTFDGLEYRITDALEVYYHHVLVPSLQLRHSSAPVHSLEELEKLKTAFPAHIQLHAVFKQDVMIAGVLFFLKGSIARSQYGASNKIGFDVRAMEFLYLEAMNRFKSQGMEIMDYGAVNLPDDSINTGLKRFKAELGAVPAPIFRWAKPLKTHKRNP